jgi:hypothetical protein
MANSQAIPLLQILEHSKKAGLLAQSTGKGLTTLGLRASPTSSPKKYTPKTLV